MKRLILALAFAVAHLSTVSYGQTTRDVQKKASRQTANVETLTADKTLSYLDAETQLLTPSGADRTVKLPSGTSVWKSWRVRILNEDAAYMIIVKTSNGTQIDQIGSGGKGNEYIARQVNPTTSAHWTKITEQAPGTRNYIINGGMDISQRVGDAQATLTASPVYFIDRWRAQIGGSFTGSAYSYRYAANPSGLAVRYSMMLQGNALNSTASYYINQRIEAANSRDFTTVGGTLSFYVYLQSATTIDVQFLYPTVSDDFTSEVQVGSTVTKVVPADSWEKISVSFPANANFSKGMDVWFTFRNSTVTGSLKNHYLTGVMLNTGDRAAPFALAGGDIQGEAESAQRYFQRYDLNYSNAQMIGWCRGISTTEAYCALPSPVAMRATGIGGAAQFSGAGACRLGLFSAESYSTIGMGSYTAMSTNVLGSLSAFNSIDVTGVSGLTTGVTYGIRGNDCTITISAEL